MATQKSAERKSPKAAAASSNSKSKGGAVSNKISLFSKAKNALMGSMRPAKSHGKSAAATTSKGGSKPAPAAAAAAAAGHKKGAKSAAPLAASGKKGVTPPPTKAELTAAINAAKKGAKGAKGAVAAVAAAATGAKGAAAKGAAGKSTAAQRRAEAVAAKAATHHDESVCREVACEGLSTTAGYCRMHYIKNWKKIKRKELILKEGKLNQYIEELVAKYPDKYIEAIRQDLASDKDFAQVIYDLDLDESIDDFDVEGEGVEGIIDSIKRDFDDEGETF